MKSRYIIVLFVLYSLSLAAQDSDKIILNDNLYIIPISENVYVHVSYLKLNNGNKYPCNGMLYFNEGNCLIVDTPTDDSLSILLEDWIRNYKNSKISGVVATHWHVDNTGGLKYFKENNIPAYSHRFTRDTLIILNKTYPENVFSDSLIIKVGKGEAYLFYPGPGHVKDNIVVWINDEEVLFGGCLVKSATAKYLGYLNDAYPEQWGNSLLNVKEKFGTAKIIIPGHGKYSGIEAIDNSIKLLKEYGEKKNN